MTSVLDPPRRRQERLDMGRKRKPDTTTIRIESDIAAMGRRCAALSDREMPELLSEILRPILTAMLKEKLKEAQAEFKSK